jgi:hypothetical protein
MVEKGAEKYYFNLCGQTIEGCKAQSNEIFAYKKSADGTCKELTDFNVASRKVVISKKEESYVQMKFGEPANKCISDPAKPSEVENYQLTLNLYCNPESDVTVNFKDLVVDNSNPCKPIITGSHPKACSLISVTSFSRYFVRNPEILGLLGLVFGLLVAFKGRMFFEYTIFATGAITGFGVSMLLF